MYCFSLLVPEQAARVRARFAHGLDTPAGRLALLSVCARLLRRADRGDFPELAAPLTAFASDLLRR